MYLVVAGDWPDRRSQGETAAGGGARRGDRKWGQVSGHDRVCGRGLEGRQCGLQALHPQLRHCHQAERLVLAPVRQPGRPLPQVRRAARAHWRFARCHWGNPGFEFTLWGGGFGVWGSFQLRR